MVLVMATRTRGAKEYRGSSKDRARWRALPAAGYVELGVTKPSPLARVASSVTDNFGNRDNLGRGASEQEEERE
jgi:hypothetical protein